MIIRIHLYGEKSHSYGVTVKTGGAPAPPAYYAYIASYDRIVIQDTVMGS